MMQSINIYNAEYDNEFYLSDTESETEDEFEVDNRRVNDNDILRDILGKVKQEYLNSCDNIVCLENMLENERAKNYELENKVLNREFINENCISAKRWIDVNSQRNFISSSVIKVNLMNILENLNKCDCCDRHQTNRVNMEDVVYGCNGEFPKSETTGLPKEGCECLCRHYSRQICREIRKLD